MKAVETAPPGRLLPLLFLANDVMQKSRARNNTFVEQFASYLIAACKHAVSQGVDAQQIEKLLKIWEERSVYSSNFMNRVRNAMRDATPSSIRHPQHRDGKRANSTTSISTSPGLAAAAGLAPGDFGLLGAASLDSRPSPTGAGAGGVFRANNNSHSAANDGGPRISGGAEGGEDAAYEAILAGSPGDALSEARRRHRISSAIGQLVQQINPNPSDPNFVASVENVDEAGLEHLLAEAVGVERIARFALAIARIDAKRRQAFIAKLIEATQISSSKVQDIEASIQSFEDVERKLQNLVDAVKDGKSVRLQRHDAPVLGGFVTTDDVAPASALADAAATASASVAIGSNAPAASGLGGIKASDLLNKLSSFRNKFSKGAGTATPAATLSASEPSIEDLISGPDVSATKRQASASSSSATISVRAPALPPAGVSADDADLMADDGYLYGNEQSSAVPLPYAASGAAHGGAAVHYPHPVHDQQGLQPMYYDAYGQPVQQAQQQYQHIGYDEHMQPLYAPVQVPVQQLAQPHQYGQPEGLGGHVSGGGDGGGSPPPPQYDVDDDVYPGSAPSGVAPGPVSGHAASAPLPSAAAEAGTTTDATGSVGAKRQRSSAAAVTGAGALLAKSRDASADHGSGSGNVKKSKKSASEDIGTFMPVIAPTARKVSVAGGVIPRATVVAGTAADEVDDYLRHQHNDNGGDGRSDSDDGSTDDDDAAADLAIGTTARINPTARRTTSSTGASAHSHNEAAPRFQFDPANPHAGHRWDAVKQVWVTDDADDADDAEESANDAWREH